MGALGEFDGGAVAPGMSDSGEVGECGVGGLPSLSEHSCPGDSFDLWEVELSWVVNVTVTTVD